MSESILATSVFNSIFSGTATQQRRKFGGTVTNGVFGNYRIVIPYNNSSWLQALGPRFEHLTHLERGWDGYEGLPVKFSCAKFAADLLERICDPAVPAPSLVPGSDGSVQAEWHLGRVDLEIDVLAPQEVVATLYDPEIGEPQRIELQNDFGPLTTWIARLRSVGETD